MKKCAAKSPRTTPVCTAPTCSRRTYARSTEAPPTRLFHLDNTLVDRQLTLADWAASFRKRHGLNGISF
jgi:hypothetical protein